MLTIWGDYIIASSSGSDQDVAEHVDMNNAIDEGLSSNPFLTWEEYQQY